MPLLHGGYIHDGQYARIHGHKGICSESEWGPHRPDLELAAKTGCKYHVCHISTKESVELIRQAKKSGVDVTCETGPHYLVLDDSCLREDGRFKMNPPLRDRSDREALVEGLRDGTIDMIATDHAPHSAEEKARGPCQVGHGRRRHRDGLPGGLYLPGQARSRAPGDRGQRPDRQPPGPGSACPWARTSRSGTWRTDTSSTPRPS